MIQALEVSPNRTSASFFHAKDLPHVQLILEHADVLIMCRTSYTFEVDCMIWTAKSRGIPVFFDIDDLIFEPAFLNLVVDSLDQDISHPSVWDSWFAYITRIGSVLAMSDGVIVTNQYLGKMVSSLSGKRVAIVPNFLNREQIDISDRIFEEKAGYGFVRQDDFRLGYFSGTPTHNKDLAVATGALERILDRYPHVTVRLAGFMDADRHFPKHAERVESIAFQNFIDLQWSIGECEVNIAPLQDNQFSNCKSELKYFEAAVVGTVTVATPTESFASAIEDGVDGYLSKSFEWDEKLNSVITNYDSLTELSIRARERCRDRYGWFNHWSVIERAIAQLKDTASVLSELG
jgi:glycosyltransferase involved in cell wall biosynthesis